MEPLVSVSKISYITWNHSRDLRNLLPHCLWWASLRFEHIKANKYHSTGCLVLCTLTLYVPYTMLIFSNSARSGENEIEGIEFNRTQFKNRLLTGGGADMNEPIICCWNICLGCINCCWYIPNGCCAIFPIIWGFTANEVNCCIWSGVLTWRIWFHPTGSIFFSSRQWWPQNNSKRAMNKDQL